MLELYGFSQLLRIAIYANGMTVSTRCL